MRVAESQLGVVENTNASQRNPVILGYSQEVGFNSVVDDETAWCSIFANWCALKAGLGRSEKMNARSWLDVGAKVDDPAQGDIVVFWREAPNSWKGHVAFYHGPSENDSSIDVLGGNQNNKVCVKPYRRDRLLGFRRLSGAE